LVLRDVIPTEAPQAEQEAARTNVATRDCMPPRQIGKIVIANVVDGEVLFTFGNNRETSSYHY
jgi:hypothetical protein